MPTEQITRPDAAPATPAQQPRVVQRIGADLWVGAGILAVLVAARVVVAVL